jgi:hypothetical protein
MRTGRPPSGRLPLHPRPLPHEALSSWVDRIARAYGLGCDQFLRAAFDTDPAPDGGALDIDGSSPSLVAALAERTGVSAERVRAMTLAGYAPELTGPAGPVSSGTFGDYAGRFGWFLPPAHRAHKRPELVEPWAPWRVDDLLGSLPRCCPRCLLAGPCAYVRLHWRLAWMASCPLHGEMLVPLLACPLLRRFLHEREPRYAAPDLLALDRITLGAVTAGPAMLPRGGGPVAAGTWLRALRALLDDVMQPAAVFRANLERNEAAAAWLRSGWLFATWERYGSVPFERLSPTDRAVVLRAASAVVRYLAVRPARSGSGTALRDSVTQWNMDQVCGSLAE